jgi:serine phosphatase RsbU (regulator of sigma subunit)
LKKLLSPRGSLGPLVSQWIDATGLAVDVQDVDGRSLAGHPDGEGTVPCDQGVPVTAAGQTLGWVAGTAAPEQLAVLAALLSHAAVQDAEKRAVAAEALDRYRELNLLYTLSEKLAAAPEPEAVAAVALDEAGRLIRARAGLALAVPGGDFCVEPVAAYGHPYRLNAEPCVGGDLIQRVLESGQPELINDVPATAVFEGEEDHVSLLCAPLKTEKSMLGVLLLVRGYDESFSAGELKLLNTVALQAAPAVEIARLYQVAVEKARMERDLHTARQVQASLIPAHMPQIPGWQFAADWRPALEVAGDYYDVMCEADGRLSLVIADVADKGMAASLLMVFARSILRASTDRSRPPAEDIERSNRLLSVEMPMGLFITMFYARLDPLSGQLTYVNAGHNPPLLYRPASGEMTALTGTGMALGLDDDARYRQRTVQIEPGDILLLYTDGVTEAFDAGQEQFGMERLEELLRQNGQSSPAELVSNLEAAVDAFTGGGHPSDDITLLIVKRL